MKKLLYFLFSLFLVLYPLNTLVSPVNAAGEWKCSIVNPPSISTDTKTINGIVIDTDKNAAPGNNYFVYIDSVGGDSSVRKIQRTATANAQGQIVISEFFDKDGRPDPNPANKFDAGPVYFFVLKEDVGTNTSASLADFKNKNINKCNTSDSTIPKIIVDQGNGLDVTKCKSLITTGTNGLKPGNLATVTIKFADTEAGKKFSKGNNGYFDIKVTSPGSSEINWDNGNHVKDSDLEAGFPLNDPGTTTPHAFDSGTYTIRVHFDPDRTGCVNTFVVSTTGGHSGCYSKDECPPETPYCSADLNGVVACRTYEKDKANNPCAKDQNGKDTLNSKDNSYTCLTAIGPIRTSPSDFIKNVLQLIFGLAGGILVIFLIINGYRLITSQGDPEKVKEARESITSAIAGLLMIIFSLALLQLVTVEILGLPGFGK